MLLELPEPDATNAVDGEQFREVRFRHSRHFLPVLQQLNASLLVSTYSAGKTVSVGICDNELCLSFNNFQQPMGLAVGTVLAVGTKGQIWFLRDGGELADSLQPAGKFDACYLARSSLITGEIHVHEMAWAQNPDDPGVNPDRCTPRCLWVVNTLFSCLCTVSDEFSFVPRWTPPFITELRAEDRCHLNGLAIENGIVRYVTAMAESNHPAGWRPTKASSGCVVDVASGDVVSRGLCMPHSPRMHGANLLVLNSGLGALEQVDVANGSRETIAVMPGYTRGLSFCGPFAFVGLSRIRETAVFGGVPIADRRGDLKCGVCVVDLRSGESVAYLEFETGMEEIFSVETLPGRRCVSLTGPFPYEDGGGDVWVIPD